MDLDMRGGREELGGIGKRKTMVRIYYRRKEYF